MPKHLRRRHRRWYATLKIPANVRGQFGDRHDFERSLGTDSLKEAERLVGPVVSYWKTQIEQARSDDPHEKKLATFREALKAARAVDDGDGEAERIEDQFVKEYAEAIEARHGYSKAQEWYDRLRGHKTDIHEKAEEWLRAEQYPPKSTKMHRQTIRLLTGRYRFVEDLDRPKAAKFVHEVLARGRAPQSATRMLSTLSQLWKWMERTGAISDGGLRRELQPRKRKQRGKFTEDEDHSRRPFTDEEARQLFAVVDARNSRMPADSLAVRTMAVTGMRLDEVCCLESQYVTEDPKRPGVVWLRIVAGKNRNAVRRVPVTDKTVSAMLLERIQKRRNDSKEDFFPEYKANNDIDSKSSAVSKRLGRRLRTFTKDPCLVASHCWRHSNRSDSERGGLRQSQYNKFFGHNLVGEGLGTYYHAEEEELVEVAQLVELPESLSGYPIS